MEILKRVHDEAPEGWETMRGLNEDQFMGIHQYFSELVFSGLVPGWNFMASDRGRMAIFMRIDWVIRNCGMFDKQVDEREDAKIKSLKEMDFSIAQIAYIMGRSKSTVHAHLS